MMTKAEIENYKKSTEEMLKEYEASNESIEAKSALKIIISTLNRVLEDK